MEWRWEIRTISLAGPEVQHLKLLKDIIGILGEEIEPLGM